jgi:acyl-coenzyme A thioesterase PaaI-like protein
MEARPVVEGTVVNSSTPLETECVACGRDNPHGLHLKFQVVHPGLVHAVWHVREGWEGFSGVVHGGIVTTVLDEAMAKAIVSTERQGLTCEIKVRFCLPVRPHDALQVEARIREEHHRLVVTEATLRGVNGQEIARADARFLCLPGQRPHHAW